MTAVLIRACALLAGASLLGLGVNALRPGGVRLSGFSPAVACSAGPAAAELEPREAAAFCSQPGLIIADVRSAAEFAQGHVAGAVHLPCDAAGGLREQSLARVRGAKSVLVYGRGTDDAKPVASSLLQGDPSLRVAVVRGGFQAWSAAGLACASGGCDDCKVSP